LRIAEQKAAARASGWVVASPEAAEVVTSFAPGASPVVIANGVETISLRVDPEVGGAPTIVLNTAFVGEGDAQEIIAFQREVLPRVRQKFPKARVLLVSREAVDSGEWRKALPGTEIIAPVGEVRAALGRATLAIALLSTSANDHASVFEPMAAGLPVVASVKTASRVKAAAGRDLLVADGAEEFARKVTMLLAQPSLGAAVGRSGQAYVSLHHTWSATTTALGGLVQALEGDLRPPQPATDEPVFEVRP
jgi:glycosyltransferase involved in cell wall biosynthesis